MTVRVNLLSRILNAVARTLLEDHEAKKNNKQGTFDQRPYFRLLSSLAQDLGVPDSKQEPNPAMTPLLGAYSQVYLALQPSAVPGFAFAWLQLISHRCFMPHLLLLKGQKGWPYMHRLITALLLFLQPFLKHAQLNDSIRRLYKGTAYPSTDPCNAPYQHFSNHILILHLIPCHCLLACLLSLLHPSPPLSTRRTTCALGATPRFP